MQLFFDVIVLLRTDKSLDACGHPVDRIALDEFVTVAFAEDEYTGSFESYMKWRKVIDYQVNRFLYSIFENKFIIGESGAISRDDTSEKHIIRVEDIRNVVVTNYVETLDNIFESTYDFRP